MFAQENFKNFDVNVLNFFGEILPLNIDYLIMQIKPRGGTTLINATQY